MSACFSLKGCCRKVEGSGESGGALYEEEYC
jgi:hypothetical protein